MLEKIEEIFKEYDFGYDVVLVSAESWEKTNSGYQRKIYLECVEKVMPLIPAIFNVYVEANKISVSLLESSVQ